MMPIPIKHKRFCIVALLLLFASSILNAQEPSVTRINSEAHVHGLASLMLAFEADIMEIQFESPAANLVGFEYKASTTDEIRLVEQAEALLGAPQTLFSFSGSACSLLEKTMDLSSVINDDHHEEGHHDEGHDDHAGDHEDQHHQSHGEITANYRFSCEDSAKLRSVSIDLFEAFAGLEKINAMWVTEVQQGSENLSATNTTIVFR